MIQLKMSTMKQELPNAKKKNCTQQPAPETISGSVDVTAAYDIWKSWNI